MSDTQKPTDFWSINPRTVELQRENADLRARLEAAEMDAGRYRWLRGQNKYRSESIRVQVMQGPNWVYPSNFYLDAAIDAAIAAGKWEK